MNKSLYNPEVLFTFTRAQLLKAAIESAPPEELEKIAEKGLNVLQLISDVNTAENVIVAKLKTWILEDLEVMKKGDKKTLVGLVLKVLEALKA